MWICGIDPSLTRTGVVVGDGAQEHTASFGSQPGRVIPPAGLTLDSVPARMGRAELLVGRILDWIEQWPVERIYIEGYAHRAMGANGNHLIEYGGLLRWNLVEVTPIIREVAPSTLKKFVAPPGGAQKNLMGLWVAKTWPMAQVANDDEVDAYALYRLGLVCEGLAAPMSQRQAEAVDTVMGNRGSKQSAKKSKKTSHVPYHTPF